MIPSSETFLIATFLQALLYGLFVATVIHSLRWLVCEDDGWKLRSRDNINWTMLTTTLLLFAFSTADLGVTLQVTFALVSGEKEASNILTVVTIALETTTVLITDAVLIYRCWLVYTKSWRVIVISLLLWTCAACCTILFDYWLITGIKRSGQITIFTPQTRRLIAVFFCCTLVNNIYATCAIAYRIWSVARGNRSGYLYVTCRIFAESGMLCGTTTLLMLIASAVVASQNLLETLLDVINFSMTGIAFNLILIRVGQQRSQQMDHFEGTREADRPKRTPTAETSERSTSDSSELTTIS